MILTDHDIRSRANEIIVTGYKEDNVNPVSYDLTIGAIVLDTGEKQDYELQPGEMVFIKTAEEIHMPNSLLGRIGEKNSRMREGLWVSGPHYFPGHQTFMFLRVKNICANIIRLQAGQKIAQIFFEELKDIPERTYDQREDASFNNEKQYRGLGKYEEEYARQIRKAEDINENLDKTQGRIYANILTLMGLFVSIFSLITVNFSQINSGNVMDKNMLLTINLSLGFVISLFMGLILLFINRGQNKKWPVIVWAMIVAALFMGLLLI